MALYKYVYIVKINIKIVTDLWKLKMPFSTAGYGYICATLGQKIFSLLTAI